MSEFLDRISKLSPQRLALLADELNERLQAAEKRRRVPLAIVGIGCRLPGGVHDPEGFWKLLSEGVDAVNEVPASRWDAEEFYDRNPDTPGKMATRWGGFIDDPDRFDPKFFGIAPAEASSMDPQQRLVLETAWEALENAGIAPASLTGTRSGVFLGICNGDYGHLAMSSPRETITPYFASGLSHAIAAGRISYVLGLQGPSLAVDTSCSASLVAVHLACQSLRLGESDTALAGGVNIVLNQDITIALSQSKMMAPDGRCKAFSDSANGFVRGEGSGMILLKRLPDAIRDRNRILAVIRGSACNQDGRSSGLTAPNGPSQEAVISAALADAGLTPDDIQYIETHGTGTSLGDPIEAGALNAVFAHRASRSSRSKPLTIGSVKSNLGHLESAAGIAGLIKLVLSLQHGKIPASLHLGKPNDRIDWEQLPLRVPTEIEAWNSGGKTRVGGVSSFGFSGTNAHVIVEEYPQTAASSSDEGRARLFTLSAKTESALGLMAARLRRHLMDHPQLPLGDVARTLNTGRSHFECRAAMTAASHRELLALLDGLQKHGAQSQVETGRVVGHSPRVAFVFDGNASFDAALGRELFETVPAFREAIEQCEQIAERDLDMPLTAAFDRSKNGNDGENTPYRNAVEFAVQYAIAQLWRSCGIESAVVLGFGVGEYVAASIAQVFSLADGLRMAILHGKNPAEFEEFVRRIPCREPQIPLIVASDKAAVASVEYWLHRSDRNGFAPAALSALAEEKPAANLYIGGNSALQQIAKSAGSSWQGKWVTSLGEGHDGCREFLNAAASLYVLGCEPDISGFYGDAANLVALPTYPFERERYWLDVGDSRNANRQRQAIPPSLPANISLDESSQWIYDLAWEPKPLPQGLVQQSTCGFHEGLVEDMAIRREWLLFADQSGVGDALHKALTATGERCEIVRRPRSPEEIDSVFRNLKMRTDPAALEIVYLWGVDVADLVGSLDALHQASELCSTTLVHLAQALLARGKKPTHLSIVTRGAQATETFSPSAGGAVQSLAWGVGRVFGLEAPTKYRALIDLDPAMTPEAAAASLLAELLAENKEDQIAFRDGRRLAARLQRSSLRKMENVPQSSGLRADGSYLLVGGLGGIGLKLARWAAEHRAGHLVLLSRTGIGRSAGGFAEERTRAVRDIESLGVNVTVVEGDVASMADMKNLFARFGDDLPPLRGVFHAATVLTGTEIADVTDEKIEAVLRSKVSGTWILHELTKNLSLDFFLVFSSSASLLGAKGMVDYAAANQFLDSFAHYRRAVRLPMLSVNWGVWDVLRLLSREDQILLSETGTLPMPSEKALTLFGGLISSPRSQVMIANIDWDILKPLFETQRSRPLLEYLGTGLAKVRNTGTISNPRVANLNAVVELAPESRTRFIEAFVLKEAAQVLGFRGGELPPVDVPLTDLGLDSLMAVDLKNSLQTALGQELSPTVVFDYPTVSELVGMLETMLWAVHGGVEDNLASAQKEEIRI